MTIAIRPSLGRDGMLIAAIVVSEKRNIFLWGWTAQITPDLARRARDFLWGVIRHGDGKGEFDTTGKSPMAGFSCANMKSRWKVA